MHVPAGHGFIDATGEAFALGLGPPSRLAAIFLLIFYTSNFIAFFYIIFKWTIDAFFSVLLTKL